MSNQIDARLDRIGDLGPCHANWVATFEWVARFHAENLVEKVDGVSLVWSGMPIAAFNTVFVLDPPQRLDGVAERVRRVFAEKAAPWRLVTTVKPAAAVQRLIEELRLQPGRPMPGMNWDPLPTSIPPAPPGLEIRRVSTLDELRTFLKIGAEGMGSPSPPFDRWFDGLVERDELRPFSGGLYLGYLDGRPVSTALRYTTGRVAGVYYVSTLPEARRKGFGAALTARAAVDGREEGGTLSHLQPTAMGRSVYEQLGYREVEEYSQWLPTPPPPARRAPPPP